MNQARSAQRYGYVKVSLINKHLFAGGDANSEAIVVVNGTDSDGGR